MDPEQSKSTDYEKFITEAIDNVFDQNLSSVTTQHLDNKLRTEFKVDIEGEDNLQQEFSVTFVQERQTVIVNSKIIARPNTQDYTKLFMQSKKLDEICEILSLTNHRTAEGTFELNYETGELRFKTQQIYGGYINSPDQIERMLNYHLIILPRGLHVCKLFVQNKIKKIEYAYKLIA